MERNRIQNLRKKIAIFFIVFGIIVTLVSGFLLYLFYAKGFYVKLPKGQWNFIMFLIAGIVFVVYGWISIKRSKNFK